MIKYFIVILRIFCNFRFLFFPLKNYLTDFFSDIGGFEGFVCLKGVNASIFVDILFQVKYMAFFFCLMVVCCHKWILKFLNVFFNNILRWSYIHFFFIFQSLNILDYIPSFTHIKIYLDSMIIILYYYFNLWVQLLIFI